MHNAGLDEGRAVNNYHSNLTLAFHGYCVSTLQTPERKTLSLASLHSRECISRHTKRRMFNEIPAYHHSLTISVKGRSSYENWSHISASNSTSEHFVGSREPSGLHTASRSSLYWFAFGIGALLEFTVLPGTLSFVLSFDELRNGVEEHNISSLPYGSLEDPNTCLVENYFNNMSSGTHVSSSQSKAEEQHWSQIVLMVQLILYLPHSISRYMTDCRQPHPQKMDEVDVVQKDSSAVLSDCGAASLFKEQLEMKKQYRLSR